MRSFAPANIISWLSVSFVLISTGKDLWGKEAIRGPHMFSEQAGTSCPCYRAWHISSKTDLSFDTLSLWILLNPRLATKATSEPFLLWGWAGELLPGAPWWPFPCSFHILTPLWGREKGALKDPPKYLSPASIIHWDTPCS